MSEWDDAIDRIIFEVKQRINRHNDAADKLQNTLKGSSIFEKQRCALYTDKEINRYIAEYLQKLVKEIETLKHSNYRPYASSIEGARNKIADFLATRGPGSYPLGAMLPDKRDRQPASVTLQRYPTKLRFAIVYFVCQKQKLGKRILNQGLDEVNTPGCPITCWPYVFEYDQKKKILHVDTMANLFARAHPDKMKLS